MRVGAVSPGLVASQPSEVAPQRTAVSMTQVRAALSHALQNATGRAPSARTLDVLSAQVSLETAHGAQMFNFNFGGIKGVSPRGETANTMTHEVLDGKDVHISQGFRAYRSLDEGARDYVSVLQARFPGAMTCATSGDLGGFAHALKQAHYYTASEQDYAAGLQAAQPQGAGGPSPLQPVPTDFSSSTELSRVMDAMSASIARIGAPDPPDPD
jgi:hypothetical protein